MTQRTHGRPPRAGANVSKGSWLWFMWAGRPRGAARAVATLGGLRLDPPTELERAHDAVELLAHAPRPREREGAEAEEPARQALVHGDRLDLPQQELERVAADEPGLDDHALVRHAKLRRPVGDERRDEQEERDDDDRAADPAGAGPEDEEERQAERQDDDRLDEHDPVEPGAIDYALVGQEILVDVAQRGLGGGGRRPTTSS